MTESVVRSFRQLVSAGKGTQRDVLLVLGLTGPRNISQFSDMVRAAGLRESAARAYSTTTLRPILNDLATRGLVVDTATGFDCAPFARELVLRDAAERGVLDRVATAVRSAAFPYLRYSTRGNEAAWFDFRVAVQRKDLNAASTHFIECGTQNAVQFATHNPLVEAVCAPFDPAWLGAFGAHQAALLAWTLDYANRFGLSTHDMLPWVYEHLEEFAGMLPMLRLLVGEAALLRGDWPALEAQLGSSEFGARVAGMSFKAALELSRGDDAAALNDIEDAVGRLQVQPGKKKASISLPRVCALLHGLALLRRGTAEDYAAVARMASAYQRDKEFEYRHSALMLKALADAAMAPTKAELAKHLTQQCAAGDCMHLLLRGLYACWFPVPQLESAYLLPQMVLAHLQYSTGGYAWLAAQHLHVAHRLVLALKDAPLDAYSRRGIERVSVPPLPQQNEFGRPLVELFDVKPGWQLALQALEQLIQPSQGQGIPDAAQERLVWRVVPNFNLVEPVLQKRTSTGWTGGRKVALKQLLPDGAQHAMMSPQDRKVAAHIREEVTTNWGGYVNRNHFVHPRALLALVNHPLVFIEPELERPAELALGQVRLCARSIGDSLVVNLEPPNLSEEPQLVQEGNRWVVYCLDRQQSAIAKAIGPKLTIPGAGKPQTLDVLGKLAQFVVIQSSEQVNAQNVPADATPWLRLVPHGVGLTVTATVRPLGEKGPILPIGHGVPTLVGNVAGSSLQTERDLALERSRMDELLRDCPALELSEVEPGHFTLTEPEQCLELVSQLRRVSERVRVEWPQGKSFQLRASIGRRALRGSLKHEGGWFVASGTLTIDSELSLELEQLIELLADGSDRFLRLETGEYVEIEQELRELVEALRVAEQRRGKKNQLAIPVSALASLEQLTSETSGLKLDLTAQEWRKRFDGAFSKALPIPRGLQAELRDYQVEGYRWLARLAELELGACLADDMGLGKTVEIIALLLRRGADGAVLVVAPTSVCSNWRREIERFAPSLRVRDYLGSNRAEQLEGLGKRDIVITSYTLLQQDSETLAAIEWSTAVLDEGQFIKNAETLRAKAAFALRARMRIVATGTPIENHPSDLWSLFHFLNPQLLGSAQRFQKSFGRAPEGSGETATRQKRELRRVLKPFILRRTKAQVLEDLPPLTEIRHTVELSGSEAQLYEVLRKRALAKLEKTGKNPQLRVQVLAELMRLRRLCCHPVLVAPDAALESSKLNAFLELVDDLLANQHRALVFSQFVDFLGLARAKLDERAIRYQYLDGATPQKDRATRVDAFQAGDGDLFLISLKAGGFGLNLTGADYVIHLDPWWNPATEQQASDRAHRIGQERPVTVYRLVTAGTIEERIIELHHRKRELANSLLEGTEGAAKISEEELIGLLTQ
jgi:superfamily II DNA or RNA helicase